MNKRFITLLLIFIAAVVLIGVLVSGHNSAPKNGTVDINFQLPSTQGLGALVNNNNLKITGLQNSYTMTPGHKEMVVIKPGYTNRTIDFTVVAGQTIIIEVTMQTNAPKTQSTATSQIASDWTGFLPSGYTVQQAVYFYSNSWVVATVNAEGG